jgi:hypothetical protein
VKEAMETTSIEERMRELTNQVILPPAGRASVNRRSLTEYPSLDSGDRHHHSLRYDHRRWTPQKRSTLRVWNVPCVRNDLRLASVREAAHENAMLSPPTTFLSEAMQSGNNESE